MVSNIPAALFRIISVIAENKDLPPAFYDKGEQVKDAAVKVKSAGLLNQATQGREPLAKPEAGVPPAGFQETLTFVPIPIECPRFPEAGFYVLKNGSPKKNEEKRDKFKILLVIKTTNLDVLRLVLSYAENNLWLFWITKTPEVGHILEKSFVELESELKKIGFENVTINARCLPGLAEEENVTAYRRLNSPWPLFDLYV